MNKELLLLLALSHIGCAFAAGKLDRVGNKELPADAVLMCDGHVVGESSGKPVHIDWQAFGINEGPSKIVQFYQSQFGVAPATDSDAQGYNWTFKGEFSELQYSVKATSAVGPWSECSKEPANFNAVVFISNAIWVKGR